MGYRYVDYAHFCSISAVRSVAGFILSSANLGPLVSLYVFQALGGGLGTNK